MKKILLAIITALLVFNTGSLAAQNSPNKAAKQAETQAKTAPFNAYLQNAEYNIFIRLNLYDKDITVPGQDIYGSLDGYIGSKQSSNVWLITSATLKNSHTAELEIINDYGSEDFTATLHLNSDGTYTLKKNGGSTFKFSVRGKWQKLPGTIQLIKK